MIRINLLPNKSQQKKESVIAEFALLGILIGVCFFFLISAMFLVKKKISNEQKNIAQIQSELAKLDDVIKQVEGFKLKKAELQSKLDVISKLNQAKSGPVKMLDAFASYLPPQLWIENYKEVDSDVTIEGISLDGPSISEFVDKLMKSIYFERIQLSSVDRIQEKQTKKFVHKYSIIGKVTYDKQEKK